MSFCFCWTCCWSSLITFWCCASLSLSTLCSSSMPSSLVSYSAIVFFNWKFSWSSSLFFFKVAFIKAWVEESSSLSVWMSFSKSFFSDIIISKTVSLPSTALALWSHIACISWSLHCASTSSSSALPTFPLSSRNSFVRRLREASNRPFCASSWASFSCIISRLLIAWFASSRDFVHSVLALPASSNNSSFLVIRIFSLFFKACKLCSSWEWVIFKFATWSCKECSLAILLCKFTSASLKLSFNRLNSEISSSGSSL